MSESITASDLLAELDQVIIETRGRFDTCQAAQRWDEAEFADNVHAGLIALREHFRSQDFLLQCQQRKENKST